MSRYETFRTSISAQSRDEALKRGFEEARAWYGATQIQVAITDVRPVKNMGGDLIHYEVDIEARPHLSTDDLRPATRKQPLA